MKKALSLIAILLAAVISANAGTFKIVSVLNGGIFGSEPGEIDQLNYQFTASCPAAVTTFNASAITLTCPDNSVVKATIPYPGSDVFIRFGSSMRTAAGNYVLNIPAGALTDTNGNTNEAWTGTWTIKSSAHAIDVEVVTPAKGQNLNSLSNVYTLSGTWASVNTSRKPYIDHGGNITEGTATIVGGVATITVGTSAFTDGGNYMLYVPEGTFVNAEGNWNTSCNATWTIKEPDRGIELGMPMWGVTPDSNGEVDQERLSNGVDFGFRLLNKTIGDPDASSFKVKATLNGGAEQEFTGRCMEGGVIITATLFADELEEAEIGKTYTIKVTSVTLVAKDKNGKTMDVAPYTAQPTLTFKVKEPFVEFNALKDPSWNAANGDNLSTSQPLTVEWAAEGNSLIFKAMNNKLFINVTANSYNFDVPTTYNETTNKVVCNIMPQLATYVSQGNVTISITDACAKEFYEETGEYVKDTAFSIQLTKPAPITINLSATGINDINRADTTKTFNIAGQRVANGKGLMIINGKKGLRL